MGVYCYDNIEEIDEIQVCGFCSGNGCIFCHYTGSERIVLRINKETGEVIDIEEYYDLMEKYSYGWR